MEHQDKYSKKILTITICIILCIFLICSNINCNENKLNLSSSDDEYVISKFICENTKIRYYYAFYVVMRDSFFTYENINEFFSYYDKDTRILIDNQFSIQIDQNKLKSIHNKIKESNLLTADEIILSVEKMEDSDKIKFLVFSKPEKWVVYYDGKFVILETFIPGESELESILSLSGTIPQEFSTIVREITEAIYSLYEDELFLLNIMDCSKQDDFPYNSTQLNYRKCFPCDLIYIDLEVEKFIAYKLEENVGENDECYGFLQERYGIENVNPYVTYIYCISDKKQSKYFRLAFNTKLFPKNYFNELEIRDAEWSEPDAYLNLLELQRICIEIRHYLENKKGNITDIRNKFQDYRKEKKFKEFYDEYYNEMEILNSFDITFQLMEKFIQLCEEKNTRSNSKFIRGRIDQTIQSTENLIIIEHEQTLFLINFFQNEQNFIETKMNEEALGISNSNLNISKILLIVTILLLIFSLIQLMLLFKSIKHEYIIIILILICILIIILIFCLINKLEIFDDKYVLIILGILGGIIGSAIAYWRYELTKYNNIVREALNDFFSIFQEDKVTKKDNEKLCKILMNLATFSNTHSWITIKWIINRYLGLDPNLNFKRKTPRYYEELTQIVEFINEDNKIKSIFRFLPTEYLFRDKYYLNWLDLAIELIKKCLYSNNYEVCKSITFIKKFIQFGIKITDLDNMNVRFDRNLVDKKFKEFLKNNDMIGIENYIRKILLKENKNITNYLKEYLIDKNFDKKEIDSIIDEIKKYFSE